MTFEGGGTGDAPLMAWHRPDSLRALHSALPTAHSLKAPSPAATLAWNNWSPLMLSLPGSVPAVVVRPTFSPISRWLRVIAAGCSFCSQGRFSLNLGAVRAGLKSNFSRKYLRRRGRLHHNVRERAHQLFSRRKAIGQRCNNLNMRLQGHAAVKVPMAFAGKLLAGKQGAAEEVAEVAEVAGDTERVHNGGSKALPI